MACPICGDWKHVGTECPRKPKGWRPGTALPKVKLVKEVVPDRETTSQAVRAGHKGQPPSMEQAGADLDERPPAKFYAPKGQCVYCDLRRAAARKAMRKRRASS